MSKKANPAVIGTFVLGATLLAVVAILTLGSSKLFEKTSTYVLYFDGDMGGLDVGAPVQYRGMRIGSVIEMRLELDLDTGDTLIPVYIELERSRLTFTGSAHEGREVEFQVNERGVRGQLQTDSLITGKKKVALVKSPESPIRLVGADPSVQEIPTIPTVEEELLQALANLPFESIVSNLNATLEHVADLAGSSEVKDAIASISQSSGKLDSLLAKLDKTVPELLKTATATAEETRGLLQDVKPAATNLGPLLVSAQKRIDEFQQVEAELKGLLAEARMMMSERSPVRYELTVALERVGGAADAFRQFIDYLQRHPEAMLAGKGNMTNDRSNP